MAFSIHHDNIHISTEREHETGVSILYQVASAIAREADDGRFILVIVGCGRVAKNIFCRRVEVRFPAHLGF